MQLKNGLEICLHVFFNFYFDWEMFVSHTGISLHEKSLWIFGHTFILNIQHYLTATK